MSRKRKVMTPEQAEVFRTKEFFDMISPGVIKFMTDHYIVGDSFRCVWVMRLKRSAEAGAMSGGHTALS